MKYDELILCCIECIQSFNPKVEGPDSHAETFLKNKTKDSHERMFIKQVLYGVLRYSDFLKVFTDNLFHMNESSTERKDEALYQIFTYITIFRLNELPLDDYRQLIYSQDAVKMNEFFKFLFNPEILNTVLRPEWIKLYDMGYVDNTLIGGLQKNGELLSDLLTNIMNKAQAGNITTQENTFKRSEMSSAKVKKLTIPEPFNITQPKPRVFQPPIQLSHKIISKPIPYEEYHKESLNKLEQKRKDRLEVIKENVIKKYEAIKPIEFETAKRPTNLEKIKQQVEEKMKKDLEFTPYYNAPKDFSNEPANVKYNETAILREEYLILKKKKQEEEDLNKILIEKKDSKEYERWRREMEEKDNLLRMEEIQKRKLELELNREVAVDYYNQRIMQNKLLVAKHKEEEQIKMKEKEKQMLKELEDKKKLVEEIDKERENIIKEKEKLAQKNRELHQKQLSEIKDIVLKAKEEKRIEDEKRKDIIRQIRELEKLPMKRTKGFDPTETPGYGLLEEMSLAELKERLENQKQFVAEFLQAKREENKIKMDEKAENLIEKAKLISNHRDKLRNKKEVERKNKMEIQKQTEEMKREIREKSLFEVKNKIENKKMKIKKEEEIFEKKIREIKLQRQYLQQGRAVVEEKAYKQIEDGLERKINDRQNKDLVEQQLKESVKWGEIKIRYDSARNEVKDKYTMFNNYDKTFQSLKDLNNECLNEENTYKKALHDKESKIANLQKTKMKEKNKYSNSLQNMSMTPNSTRRKTKTPASRIILNSSLDASRSLSPKSIDSDGIKQKLEKEMA